MEIRVLIFDLGGVVFDCSFDKTFQKWATLIGRDKDEIQGQFKFSDTFEKFERGDISPGEFIESVSQQLNYKFSYETFEEGWNAIYLDLISDIDNLLRELKKRYRLVALTNTNIVHQRIWTKKYKDTLSKFEKVFSSNEMQTRKPEAKSFQMVLDYLNVSPGETIFLDNKQEYLEGAQSLGINTILVSSYGEMLESLMEFKIER